jgi:hypothetical protein
MVTEGNAILQSAVKWHFDRRGWITRDNRFILGVVCVTAYGCCEQIYGTVCGSLFALSDILAKRNARIKLESANILRIFAFHSLKLKVTNRDIKYNLCDSRSRGYEELYLPEYNFV